MIGTYLALFAVIRRPFLIDKSDWMMHFLKKRKHLKQGVSPLEPVELWVENQKVQNQTSQPLSLQDSNTKPTRQQSPLIKTLRRKCQVMDDS